MQIIINGDDFGDTSEVNRAIQMAHQQGILTSASLMVNGEACHQAVEISRQLPAMAVGMHVVVTKGKAALPYKDIPHLVDRKGYFPDQPVRAGLNYFFSKAAQHELTLELSAQFERFASTGLVLDHINGHEHMHIHPTVFKLCISFARDYGAAGIRIPRDDFGKAVRFDRSGNSAKAAEALIFSLLNQWCLSHIKKDRFVVVDRVYGLFQSGKMSPSFVSSILTDLKVNSAELYFHPSFDRQANSLGPNMDDFYTLTNPVIKNLLIERDVQLSTYREICDKSGC